MAEVTDLGAALDLTNRLREHPHVSAVHMSLRGYKIYEPENDVPIIEINRQYDGSYELYEVYMTEPEFYETAEAAKLRALELLA